jgi:calcineurin-like phosphoesterase family protein
MIHKDLQNMPNVFLISDTHFTHHGMYNFMHSDGGRVRREFENTAEGDEAMVENWNSVVGVKDKVYHLGDVFINRSARHILDRLNGTKVLIKGNHDIFDLKTYLPYFKDIRAYHRLDGVVLSHIPLHPNCLYNTKGNIHGHLHRDAVLLDGELDTRYLSVCVERIGYTPMELGVALKYLSP